MTEQRMNRTTHDRLAAGLSKLSAAAVCLLGLLLLLLIPARRRVWT